MPRDTRPTEHTPSPRPLLSPQRTADRLNVSLKTVRRLIASGSLPAYRIGRQFRISEEALAHFISARRVR